MSKLPPPGELSFAETHSLAERWRMWSEEMRLYLHLAMSKDSEKDKFTAFLYIIGRSGREIYNTWSLTADEMNKVESLFDRFERYCKPKQNITLERYRFNSRTQKPGESLDEFVTDLRKLAKLCQFQTLEEEMVKDRIVVGIHNQSLKERLLREPDLNLEQAMFICRADEESRKGLTLMGHADSTSFINRVHNKERIDRKSVKNRNAHQNRNAQQYKQERSNCSRCGSKHPPKTCPAYGKTCHACKGANHFSTVCRKKETHC